MLDIALFREGVCCTCAKQEQLLYVLGRRADLAMYAEKGGNPELVRESQRRRFADPGLVDRVIELDAKWRDGKPGGVRDKVLKSRDLAAERCALAAQYKVERQRTEFNALNKQIGNLRKVRSSYETVLYLRSCLPVPTRTQPSAVGTTAAAMQPRQYTELCNNCRRSLRGLAF